MKRTLICLTALMLILFACGSEGDPAAPGFGVYLIGDWTQEEAQAVTDVMDAFESLGVPEPAYRVRFLHDLEQARGILPPTQHPDRNPCGLARGVCRRDLRIVYVRRFGSAEPYLYELLVHELLHAVGYEHGQEMKEMEHEVMQWVGGNKL